MLFIEETYVNRTAGHNVGESGKYEPFTDNVGELYRRMQSLYGRCTGYVYVDVPLSLEPKAVGWVFVKRQKYDDCNESYLQETWVTLYDQPTTVIRREHYRFLHA